MNPERAIFAIQERKLDALDLVLNVLREHEESLDSLIERLETSMEAFSTIQHHLENICARRADGMKWSLLCRQYPRSKSFFPMFLPRLNLFSFLMIQRL